LSALEYHYWTQPLPNPLSWWVNLLPSFVHKISCAIMLVIELIVPWTMAFGRWGKRTAGVALIGLQLVIALTGNYGWFNLLAIVLCIPLFDDRVLDRIDLVVIKGAAPFTKWRRIKEYVQLPVLALVALGIVQIAVSMGSPMPESILSVQRHVSSFEAVNGYGLFAIMTTERSEIVIEGSLDGVEWRPYRFRYKPDDPHELPSQSAPHMPRLDWQMWFAALGDWRDSPWLIAFMRRLHEGEPHVLDLLESDPFHGQRPRFVRARASDWRFGDWSVWMDDDRYWTTGELEPYSPIVR
jgi:lipase maturation factor 1